MPALISAADPLLTSLAAALASVGSPWASAPLQRLKDKGLAHDHVRLRGTTWGMDSHAVLAVADVVGAYATWAAAAGTQAAHAAAPWHVPLRRAMWLWSITWCAKWRAVSGNAAHVSADGEDWSTEHSGSALVVHVRGRVDHYPSPVVVAQVLGESEALDVALDQALGA